MDLPLLLIDETKGRTIARFYKINVIGTLGILALANKRKLKTKQEISENLRILVNRGFFLLSNIVLSFLEKLD